MITSDTVETSSRRHPTLCNGTNTSAIIVILILCLLFATSACKSSSRPDAGFGSVIAPTLNSQGLQLATDGLIEDLLVAVSGTGDSALNLQQALALAKIDLAVNARTFETDYEANELAGDAKYKNRRFLLSGVIKSIEKDSLVVAFSRSPPATCSACGYNSMTEVFRGQCRCQRVRKSFWCAGRALASWVQRWLAIASASASIWMRSSRILRTRCESSSRVLVLQCPFRQLHRGKEMRLIIGDNQQASSASATSLTKALARARCWYEQVVSGSAGTIAELASQSGVTPHYVPKLFPCALLAPDLVELILGERQAPLLTLDKLATRLPLDWKRQRSFING